jgi:hypothetical protein
MIPHFSEAGQHFLYLVFSVAVSRKILPAGMAEKVGRGGKIRPIKYLILANLLNNPCFKI